MAKVQPLVGIVLGAGVLALLYTFIKSAWVSKQDVGTEKMAKIAKKFEPVSFLLQRVVRRSVAQHIQLCYLDFDLLPGPR